jgi:hypothetical protein
MAGMFIGFAKRNPKRVQLDHVVEGTLNYCSRHYSIKELRLPEIYRLTVARLIKKCLSLIFGFVYDLSFSDNVDLPIKSSVLICRKKEGLISNARLIKVISSSNNDLIRIFNPAFVSPTLAIVGSHIIESYLGVDLRDSVDFFKPLSEKLNNLPIDQSKLEVVYLPHPRATKNGMFELNNVYNHLSPSVVNDPGGAKNYVLSKNPSHILCLGGSTLFMELAETGFQGELIAWGFDELIEMGCNQAQRLLDVQNKLKVTIF